MLASTYLVGVYSGAGVGVDSGGSESELESPEKSIDSTTLNPDHKNHIMLSCR